LSGFQGYAIILFMSQHKFCTLIRPLCLFCCGLAFFPARAADPFRSFSSQAPGRVQDLIVQDLDQDGLQDLFITYVEGRNPNHTRGIVVYFQNPDGFSDKSRQIIPVDDQVALVDVGQVDGEPGLDIVCIGRGQVSYYPLRGRTYGKPTRFVSAHPFTVFADDSSLPYYDFLQDWNGDGKDELLLLEFERSLIYPAGEHGLSTEGREILLQAKVTITMGGPERIFQEHHSLRAFYWMPQLNTADYDGDGRKDLVASQGAQLNIFRQQPDGSFDRDPTWQFRLNLPQPPPKEGKKPRGEQNPPIILVDDVNRDGKMDVIASQLVGGFGDLKSQTFIYYGQTGALAKNKWDQEIDVAQAGTFPLLRDLDGDGSLDLIIPYVPIDILSIAKMIITTSLDVRFKMYVLGKKDRYPALPTAEESSSIKINFRELTVEGGVPNVDGDFDGDGINDVVVGKNVKELQILRGLGGGAFAQEPSAVIPVAAPLFPVVADLNHDGLADVAISYIPFTDHDHQIYVFLNNGRIHGPAAPLPAAKAK